MKGTPSVNGSKAKKKYLMSCVVQSGVDIEWDYGKPEVLLLAIHSK